MKTRFYLIASLFFACNFLFGQISTINPTMTPAQAVQNVLLGAGINAFNVTYNGSAAAANQVQAGVKQFSNTSANFPITSGISMGTNGAPGVSDPDLTAISNGGNITNGSIIEFDFVPTGDTLSFNYIFSSMEYQGYTCSSYNDAFGFFISGPGINGPFSNNAINIATVPGTTVPVAINTVNSGSASLGWSPSTCAAADPNWQNNSIYFTTSYNSIFNNSGMPFSDYNGSTILLTANSTLTCGDTFHIKLAVSNVTDTGLDSGVFLQANSFASNGVNINITPNVSLGSGVTGLDTLLIEGCTSGQVIFSRPSIQSDTTLTIHFTDTSGTATPGVDFPQIAPGDSVFFAVGQDSVILNVAPIQDSTSEGPESIIISAYTVTDCGDTIVSKGVIWIDDEPHSIVTATDTTVLCQSDSIPLNVNTTHGFPPYTYAWSNGDSTNHIYAPTSEPPSGQEDIIVTSTDACGFQYTDTASIILNQMLAIDTMMQHQTACGEATGWVSGQGSGFTGTPHYVWTNSIIDSIPGDSITASVWQNLPAGWYYFSIKDDVCKVLDSIQVQQDPPPNASFDADPQVGNSPLNVTFTNTSDVADEYDWNFGNGDSTVVNDLSTQHSTYIDKGTYTVTLIVKKGGCTNTATKTVTVKLPVKYDRPNVFTPNGDGTNDFFKINAENAKDFHIVILNRWGNEVFESDKADFQWNGQKDNSGTACDDGVYFYKFTIAGFDGKKHLEYGYIHLLREGGKK